jgi:hypothetical protein
VACTDYLTAMHVGDRSARTIDAGGIWPEFRGVLGSCSAWVTGGQLVGG